MAIKERVMIVTLHMSQWAGRKYDAEASREVQEAHQAETDAARVTKQLIGNSPEFQALKSNQSAARRYHYKMTLAWDDKGPRIIPVEEYFNYVAEMEKFKNKNELLLDEFINVFEDAVHKAKKKLGTLFNKKDYPSTDELKRKFTMTYSFAPIADETDLRIKLEKDEIEVIKKNIEAGMQEKIRQANKGIVERMVEVTHAVYKRLKEKDTTFRDSLIDNVKAVRELVPTFNFTNDETVNAFNKKLKKICVKPDKIRKNVQVRKDVEKDAKKLLKKFNEYLNS